MKHPPHPGVFIRDEILEPLGLSITKAAKVLGVRRATLSDVTNGNADVSAEMALVLPTGETHDVGAGTYHFSVPPRI